MSTAAPTPSPNHPSGDSRDSASAPAPAPGGAVRDAPVPGRAGSGALARILTVLYALIVTPPATGLVLYGAMPWHQFLLPRAADVDALMQFLSSPTGRLTLLALVGGLLLLVTVVATGVASSAGLLSISVLSVVPLSLSLAPQLMTSLYEIMPDLFRTMGFGPFSQGLALVLYPVLGGMGLALVIARRRPRPPLAVSLTGVVLVPVVTLVASLLIMYGYAALMRSFAETFGAGQVPVPAVLALVIGMVLLWLSIGSAGGSPYSLVIPALFLLGFSITLLVPDLFRLLPGFMFSPIGSTALSVVAMGTGPAVAIALLAHTAVQGTVASRARRRHRRRPSAI